jgi:hypothetical protein
MQHRYRDKCAWFGISLVLLFGWPAMTVGAEVERINPAGVYKHPTSRASLT